MGRGFNAKTWPPGWLPKIRTVSERFMKIKVTTGPADNPPPTYAELADLVAELTEINIAGLDLDGPGTWSFVSCFTYGAKVMPPHWQRAIDARESLIENKMIRRQNRKRT